MTISEPEFGPDLCPVTEGGMKTVYPEPTDLPYEPCTESFFKNDTKKKNIMLKVLVPVAAGVVMVCVVIVGVGVLFCYIIVAKEADRK